MAALDVASGSDQKYWIAPQRSLQPTDKATARGTVFHERRTGEAASVFVDDGFLLLRLTCRAAVIGITWPIPEELDDTALERKLFAPAGYNPPRSKPLPEWGHIHAELRRRGVTLALL